MTNFIVSENQKKLRSNSSISHLPTPISHLPRSGYFKLNTVFHFAASHYLTSYHGKCEKLHGHNYKLIITIKGAVKADGMVMDYKEIKKTVKEKVIKKLDHSNLNDRFENPSSENVSIWIWDELKDLLPLSKVTLFETENYFCEYEGE